MDLSIDVSYLQPATSALLKKLVHVSFSRNLSPIACSLNTPGCTRLAVADAKGLISAWDVRFGALLSAAQAHEGAATSAHFNASSDVVVSCGYDGTLSFLQVSKKICDEQSYTSVPAMCAAATMPHNFERSASNCHAQACSASGPL